MTRDPTPRAVHGIHGRWARRPFRRFRRRRLPKQAALLRRLPQRPALPAAAPPETGGASAAASAAAGASGGRLPAGGFRSSQASGGGASRNRRRFCGGFRSGRRFRQRLPKQAASRRRLPQRPALPAAALRKQAASRWRLPQRPALPAAAPPEIGSVSTAASAAAGASGGGASRNRRRFCGGFRSGRRFRRRRLPQRAPARCARAVCSVCSVCLHPTPGARIHALCMYRPRPCTRRTPGLSPLSGTRPAVDPGSTVKSRIRESRAQSRQRPASDAATQSAHQRRQWPCSRGNRQHGGASSARVTHGRQWGFVRHAGPHTHDRHAAWTGCMSTPAARTMCFSATPKSTASMLYQCTRRAPGIHPSRSPEAPQDAQSANSRRNPRRRLQSSQRHKAPASAVSPHYSARNGSPLSSDTRTDDHAFPARFWSTPSMPCPDTRGGPVEHPANPRPLHDEPRKIPNLQVPG